MIPIVNPFLDDPDYLCFGCSPKNEAGLQLKFFLDGEEVVAKWEPKDHFAGFDNILHGGIRATLIDEIAAWAVFMALDTMGYTTRLEVKFAEVVYTNKGALTLRARVKETTKKLALIAVDIYDSDDRIVTTGEAEYFLIPSPVARKKMGFPPREAFFAPEDKTDP